jgi:hypothetical protein
MTGVRHAASAVARQPVVGPSSRTVESQNRQTHGLTDRHHVKHQRDDRYSYKQSYHNNDAHSYDRDTQYGQDTRYGGFSGGMVDDGDRVDLESWDGKDVETNGEEDRY